jgi:ribosome biogenesis GTPase A
LWRVVEFSDVLLFVADIRNPLLHFPPTLYDYIVHQQKKQIMVFSKVDLVPESLVLEWTEYFQREYPMLGLKQFSFLPGEVFGKDRDEYRVAKYLKAHGTVGILEACRDVMGKSDDSEWNDLLEKGLSLYISNPQVHTRQERVLVVDKEKEERPSKSSKKQEHLEHQQQDPSLHSMTPSADSKLVTIGLIGHPNVGKSSLLNSLMSKIVVSSSATPGRTKHFQTIHLSKSIRGSNSYYLILKFVIVPALYFRPRLEELSSSFPEF